MKPVITLLILIIGTASFAQKRDTTFIKDSAIVSKRDSADYIRIIDSVGTNDYNITEIYKSGKPKLSAKASAIKPFIKFEGEVNSLFENGSPQSTIHYTDGKNTSTRYRYYPNGKLYVVETYLGIDEFLTAQFLVVSLFDSLGVALITDGNGHFKGYDESFKQITEEGDIKNGRKNGEWKFNNLTYSRVEFYNENGAFTLGTCKNNTGEVRTYTKREELPLFEGGQKGFIKYLNSELKYPKDDRKKKIQGRVVVQFVVEKDGTLNNIMALTHVSPDIDQEAIRVFQNSPKWKPGLQYGFPVRAQYTVPINFSLN